MSLAAWLDGVDGGRKASALARLAKLSGWKLGRVVVPFPFRDRDEVKQDVDNEEINEGINEAPVVYVPLRDLHAIQHSVDPKCVAAYIENGGEVPEGTLSPKSGVPVDRPIVLLYKGIEYLWDGHHRATAMLLMGEEDVEARLVVLG